MRCYLILLVIFGIGELKAQINPPDFQCVRNDTLFWDLPVNTCGAFNSHDIYFSEAPNGPFVLLTSITNATQTDFFHNNPAGTTFYYYMTAEVNCPGEPQLSSDTLNNESPNPSPINVVTVNGAIVEIDWTASNSPEVTNYIIYRTSPIGALPIDTVGAAITQYIDLGADPDSKPESYFVLAMDACGNTSVFDLPHFTIFIDIFVDPCDRRIELQWNRYRNWLNAIANQELWISTNGASFELLENLSASASTYTFSDTNDGDEYCFFIKAVEQSTGVESQSGVRCLTLDIVEPVRNLFLKNVSVNDANQVDVTWQWNDNAEVAEITFLESADGNSYLALESLDPGNNLNSENTYTLTTANPISNKQFYRLNTRDDCDSLLSSNIVPTVHLIGVAQSNQSNLINWTAFERPDGSLENYDIYRVVDGLSTFLETVNELTRTYIDNSIDITNPAERNVCYYVVANAIITDPDGNEISIASQSNTVCVEQLSDLIIPNAFVPEGVNKEFKPVVVFGETVDYHMQIFDRWGKKIFESIDQNQGWNGRDGFFYFPAGVYVYIIRITQTNGRIVEKKGNVALIR